MYPSQVRFIYALLGGEAVTTPTFQLGSTGSTPSRDIFTKNYEKTLENVC